MTATPIATVTNNLSSLAELVPSPTYGVVPTSSGGTAMPNIIVAATKSGTTQVGTTDTSPTETEVVALMQTVFFSASDRVMEVNAMFSVVPTLTAAAQSILAVVNGNDDYEDADALATRSGQVVELFPNILAKIQSDVAITRISFVATPSGVASSVTTGQFVSFIGRIV